MILKIAQVAQKCVMKILQINKFLYPKGGSETYMFQLADLLKRGGHDVEFWGMKSALNIVDDVDGCFAEEIDFSQLSGADKILKTFSTIYSKKNRRKIGVILDRFKPDIVHIHNYNFQLTPSILPEIKKRNIKIVHTMHDSQIACPFHRLYNYEKESICVRCTTGKYYNSVLTRCFRGSLMKSLIGMSESYFYHTRNYYNKYIDAFISPSAFLANIVKRKITRNIHVVPNFVQPISVQRNASEEYVLYFGRISKEKGILNIQSFFEKNKRKLLIVGDGLDKEGLRSGEYIQYLGPKYGDELQRFIANAQYVIQPSQWYENCPMTVIESFACGTPVICSKHSGFLEMVKDGENGYLIDFKNSEDLKKLQQVLGKDVRGMRENCLTSYNQRYSAERHIKQILAIYRGVLDENI